MYMYTKTRISWCALYKQGRRLIRGFSVMLRAGHCGKGRGG